MERNELINRIIQALLAVVLIVAMTYIIVTPQADNEVVKGALVIIGSAVGYIFGKNT